MIHLYDSKVSTVGLLKEINQMKKKKDGSKWNQAWRILENDERRRIEMERENIEKCPLNIPRVF